MTIRFLDPTQPAEVLPASLATQHVRGRQLTLGLLSNSKPNADRLLRLAAERLSEILSIQQIVEVAKDSSSTNASPELLDQLADQADLALVAIGDWGSCSSCSLHDGLELETRGVPAVVVCTEPFQSTGEAICVARGIADYRFAIVEHPIGSLTDSELQQRAEAAFTALRGILADRGLI